MNNLLITISDIFKNEKPVTSSQRHLVKLNKKNLEKKPFIKKHIKGLKNLAGRNNSGSITVRHKGGGHKKKYRRINFQRTYSALGIVCGLEYDPNRNSNIASVYEYLENKFYYILAPNDLNKGDIIKTGTELEPKIGYSLPISEIPEGSFIHNISLSRNKPAQITRAAGTFSVLKQKTLNNATIELSSGEKKIVSSTCFATIGTVSNEFDFLTQLGKAGRSRWLNKRPITRGVAMNPIDHPHGGGEGKKSGKGKNLWGKPTKSKKINLKKPNNHYKS